MTNEDYEVEESSISDPNELSSSSSMDDCPKRLFAAGIWTRNKAFDKCTDPAELEAHLDRWMDSQMHVIVELVEDESYRQRLAAAISNTRSTREIGDDYRGIYVMRGEDAIEECDREMTSKRYVMAQHWYRK